MTTKKIKIAIVGGLDKISNEKRVLELKNFLEKRNFNIKIFASKNITELPFKFSYNLISFWIKKIFAQRLSFINYPLIEEMFLRAEYWGKVFKEEKIDILIMEGGVDSAILLKKSSFLKICDAPALWSEEAKYSHQYSNKYINQLIHFEKKIYQSADFFCFHWYSYADYYKNYLDPLAKPFTLNWGCDKVKKEKQAKFNFPPKIIFLGSLFGYWNNIKLLSALSKNSGISIDVYGPTKPPQRYHLHYLGYLRNLDVIANYQFGLNTFTEDRLRKQGFSSKQMLYASYGLPSLVPEWRKDKFLQPITISYNQENFIDKIKLFSKRKKWQKISKQVRKFAKHYYWEEALKPLEKIIKENFKR